MIYRPHAPYLLAPLLALAACGGGSEGPANRTESAPKPVVEKTVPEKTPPQKTTPPKPTAPSPEQRSCRDEIGAEAAARRVRVCRNVSPATHPPCNVANSCKMIDDEITRSCALFADDGPPMPGCPVS